ncbi:glutathione peroxidase [Vitreoscilla massiliensis]|uniref:Glutathione peroxidase n=1 Tax=Vitreoscilla massiliensis TaxID=1689272 RepID=A0ABY4DZC3_9NEIS|nr:glutathione peroxidase [Vitreoscilla massiliensis]UOO88461.1 glutathione peroxidase [Vitreoscilla massiliensis]
MSVYSHTLNSLTGESLALSQFQGQALLLFNSASHCGFTPQLAQFEYLQKQYACQGLQIIGFPCNQFKQQKPDSNQEISEFCQINYGVSFLMTEKIEVNGPHTHPLWRELKAARPGVLGTQRIKWNFTKFLVAPDGSIVKRAAPYTSPLKLINDIERLLSQIKP